MIGSETNHSLRWWPKLSDLPPSLFVPGWFGFSLRTWISVCIALGTAFWAQISTPAGAAVTVMILAQPLRGQALSKAIYRMLGTLGGMIMAIVLAAAFPQNRIMFLGGAALWMAGCAFIGTLERNFRSYGALLAGYTVALVALSGIDQPEHLFNTALSRVSCIGIGVATVAVVNLLGHAPQAWRGMAEKMDGLAQTIRELGIRALAGKGTPDAWETTGLAAQVLSLLSQISWSWIEIDHAAKRLSGARLGIIGMLEVLTCCRGLAAASLGRIAPQVVQAVQDGNTHAFPAFVSREDVLSDLWTTLRAKDPHFLPSAHEAYFLERAAALMSNTAHIDTGMHILLNDGAVRTAQPVPPLGQHIDFLTAFTNAFRVLVGVAVAACLCIWLGHPSAQMALNQTALTLVLASTAADTAAFGLGAVIGIPLAVAVASVLHFYVLPYVNDMVMLAMVLLPEIVGACLLLLNPKTSAIGFNFGVFFPVNLGMDNHHNFDPNTFISRNVFYLLSAVISFVMLALLLPTNAHKRRMWLAVAVGRDLDNQLSDRGEAWGPGLLGRKYERLSTLLQWSRRLPVHGTTRRLVFDRLARLEDFATTTARLRHVLKAAMAHPALAPEAERVRNTLCHAPIDDMAALLTAHGDVFLAIVRDGAETDRIRALTCVASTRAVTDALMRNRETLRRYGLAPLGAPR